MAVPGSDRIAAEATPSASPCGEAVMDLLPAEGPTLAGPPRTPRDPHESSRPGVVHEKGGPGRGEADLRCCQDNPDWMRNGTQPRDRHAKQKQCRKDGIACCPWSCKSRPPWWPRATTRSYGVGMPTQPAGSGRPGWQPPVSMVLDVESRFHSHLERRAADAIPWSRTLAAGRGRQQDAQQSHSRRNGSQDKRP
jgi:hypothetical protein